MFNFSCITLNTQEQSRQMQNTRKLTIVTNHENRKLHITIGAKYNSISFTERDEQMPKRRTTKNKNQQRLITMTNGESHKNAGIKHIPPSLQVHTNTDKNKQLSMRVNKLSFCIPLLEQLKNITIAWFFLFVLRLDRKSHNVGKTLLGAKYNHQRSTFEILQTHITCKYAYLRF